MLVLDALGKELLPLEPASSSSVPACTLKLLTPPPSAAPLMGIEGTETSVEVSLQGHCNLVGSVHGMAYVAKREPFFKAVAELKVRDFASLVSSVASTGSCPVIIPNRNVCLCFAVLEKHSLKGNSWEIRLLLTFTPLN